jgi:hypothetical protein
VITVAVLLFANAGCSSESEQHQETERMLIAAGFHAEPADTPEKQAPLETLPPHTLVAEPLRVGGSETRAYVYADPDVCHCASLSATRRFIRPSRSSSSATHRHHFGPSRSRGRGNGQDPVGSAARLQVPAKP